MSKDDLIDMQGTVFAVHSGGLYRVQVDAGHEVLAQLSGRMRRFRIKVVPGDRVTVGISPYDPQRGIITFRARLGASSRSFESQFRLTSKTRWPAPVWWWRPRRTPRILQRT